MMLKIVALVSFLYLANGQTSDVGLNTVELIEKHNYTCETHNFTTEDGYVLTYHRIPAKSDKVVFLMHGVPSSSADYVNMGTNRSLGFIFADLGYDVWMGNARGNFWSRTHLNFTPEDNPSEFFDFSWHEVGYYDLATAVDYILEETGVSSLHYVAHSMGCAQFLVLTSTRPEYNKKIRSASLMAPAVFMENNQSPFLNFTAQHLLEMEGLLVLLGMYEMPGTDLTREIGMTLCANPNLFDFCVWAIGILCGTDAPQMEQEKLPVIFSNLPSSTAMKQFIHSGQLIRNGGFSQFDYGLIENLIKYQSEVPPPYNLSNVVVPVGVYYGKNDLAVNFTDAQLLVQKLPNVVNDYLVPYDLFNHIDFLFAKDVYDLVYKELIAEIEKH